MPPGILTRTAMSLTRIAMSLTLIAMVAIATHMGIYTNTRMTTPMTIRMIIPMITPLTTRTITRIRITTCPQATSRWAV